MAGVSGCGYGGGAEGAGMKVFGINYNGRERRIVAANSRTDAARKFGVTAGHAKNFCGETGNPKELELAALGGVWAQSYSGDKEWRKVG